uniref:NACHT domain-containing protein n=2 Tax=Caenorhabditis japonica TaxID=281687 RepID=A0A8R1E377_CAEJA
MSLPAMIDGCSFIFFVEYVSWSPQDTECSQKLSEYITFLVLVITIVSFSINLSSIVRIVKMAVGSNAVMDENISASRKRRRRKMFVQCVIQDCTHTFDCMVNTYVYALYSAQWFQFLCGAVSALTAILLDGSTFTDTTVERNALMEDIYPKLKEYCRETHGLDFQVVDMRWGVRDEATDDHMTTKLCINEIANCQRLSVGANFVVFLCQKYGYRPIPSEILSTELEMLKRTLKEENEDITLLDSWYIEDSNSVPPMFVLQPISSILVNFNNKVNSEAQKLLSSLRDERVPAKLSIQNIRRSTVEWIGRDGIDVQYHAEYIRQFCSDFYKSITTMVDNAMEKHARFRDQLFTEVLTHLTTGKTVSNMFFGRDLQLECAREYILGNSNLPMILQGENGCGKTSLMAKIAIKIRDWYASSYEPVVLLRFLGTSPDSSNIVPLLTSVCDQVCRYSLPLKVLPSRLGDLNFPSVLACTFELSRRDNALDYIFIDLVSNGILIAMNYDQSLKNCSPTELSKLFQHFKKITYLASREKPLIIIFDSLDLLSTIDGAHELLWFPPSLPPYVKLFASLTPGASLISRYLLTIKCSMIFTNTIYHLLEGYHLYYGVESDRIYLDIYQKELPME